MIHLAGYLDNWLKYPGDTVTAMLGASETCEAQVQLVRLLHADENPAGPGLVQHDIEASCNGQHALGPQKTRVGNLLATRTQHPEIADEFTLWAFASPWLTDREQVLLARQDHQGQGVSMNINSAGQLELQLGDVQGLQRYHLETPLLPRQWMLLVASVSSQQQQVQLWQKPVDNSWADHWAPMMPWDSAEHRTFPRQGGYSQADTPFTLAARYASDDSPELCFNGRLDRCGMHKRVLSENDIEQLLATGDVPADELIVAWNPSLGLDADGVDDCIRDTGPADMPAWGINKPVRALTGFNWDGFNECYRLAPEQFGAVHCHADALEDANWSPSLEFALPSNLASGVYALRVTVEKTVEYIPFFISPRTAEAKIAVILPTATYNAAANERTAMEPELRQGTTGEIPILTATDRALCDHPEYGLSTRDCHIDGSGVCFASRLRPLPTLNPAYRDPHTGAPRHLGADLALLWWLDKRGLSVDILTDERVHSEGTELLQNYPVIISGSEPEVATPQMLDALEDYLASGGRYINAGAHGHYWVGGFAGEDQHLVEIRQLDTGSRDWQSLAGEYYLATTGERGGLWRHRGRAPQKLVGVGFTSEGTDKAVPYRKMPDAWHRMYHWLFKGIEDEVFGASGLSLDGAAGASIDRYDWTLGTPTHARIIASSAGHSDMYPVVHEDLVFNFPGQFGTWDERIRADMVLFTTHNHGAVFSAGSSTFAQSLPVDANASRLFRNLLDAFLTPGDLPGTGYSNLEKHWR